MGKTTSNFILTVVPAKKSGKSDVNYEEPNVNYWSIINPKINLFANKHRCTHCEMFILNVSILYNLYHSNFEIWSYLFFIHEKVKDNVARMIEVPRENLSIWWKATITWPSARHLIACWNIHWNVLVQRVYSTMGVCLQLVVIEGCSSFLDESPSSIGLPLHWKQLVLKTFFGFWCRLQHIKGKNWYSSWHIDFEHAFNCALSWCKHQMWCKVSFEQQATRTFY